jgi:PKHD-type hydroxylase
MLLHIDSVLSAEEAESYRAALESANWVEGRLAESPPAEPSLSRQLSDRILAALECNPVFLSAAIPHRIFPPFFNRYQGGHSFEMHVNDAIRQAPASGQRVRTDLSAMLFLTDPDEYDGGELVIEDIYGTQSLKLPAGDLALYSSSSLHHVEPVIRGSRISSFFWTQSQVRCNSQRAILFDLDMTAQGLSADDTARLRMAGIYQNLLRMWAEV